MAGISIVAVYSTMMHSVEVAKVVTINKAVVVAIAIFPSIVVGIPSDMVLAIYKRHCVWMVAIMTGMVFVKRHPDPSICSMMSPDSVVIGVPTPRIIGYPSVSM